MVVLRFYRLKMTPIKKISATREEQSGRRARVESGCHRSTKRQRSEYQKRFRRTCRSNNNGVGAPLSKNKSPVPLLVSLSRLYKYVCSSKLSKTIITISFTLSFVDMFAGSWNCQSASCGEEGERGKCKILLQHSRLLESQENLNLSKNIILENVHLKLDLELFSDNDKSIKLFM